MITRLGSSPLARGLHTWRAGKQLSERIIPARAGFTTGRSGRPRHRGDHPRSRGVYPAGPSGGGHWRGSSPLARGLRGPHRPVSRGFRIIPARAGFTSTTGPPSRPSRDHPRSRGVYDLFGEQGADRLGSSPLARGLRHRRPRQQGLRRIIPARAGFTASRRRRAWSRRDHPRSRGVYLAAEQGVSIPARIIPARAGFTSPPPSRPRSAGDHPRSRGVYPLGCISMRIATGSSPLARGLLSKTAKNISEAGIIPARAGFTSRRWWR